LKCKAKGAAKSSRKENTFFRIAKRVFVQFSSFWPLLFYQCITFSWYVQIEQFKLLWNFHLKLYKSACNSNGNSVIFKDFVRGSQIGYELFDWNLLQGELNLFTFHSFLSNFNTTDMATEGLHLLFGHHKQWALMQKWQAKPMLSVQKLACLPYIGTSPLILWESWLWILRIVMITAGSLPVSINHPTLHIYTPISSHGL